MGRVRSNRGLGELLIQPWKHRKYQMRRPIHVSIRKTGGHNQWHLFSYKLVVNASGRTLDEAVEEFRRVIDVLVEDIFYTDEPSTADFAVYREEWAELVEVLEK